MIYQQHEELLKAIYNFYPVGCDWMRDYYSGFGKLKELIKNKIKLIENKNTPSTTIEHQLIEVFPNDKVINCDYFMFPNYLFKIVLQTHNIQSDFKAEESIIINISLLCDYYTIFLENQYSKYDRNHLLYILQENKFENTILIKKEIKHKIDAIITNVFPEKKFINHFILKSLKIEKCFPLNFHPEDYGNEQVSFSAYELLFIGEKDLLDKLLI